VCHEDILDELLKHSCRECVCFWKEWKKERGGHMGFGVMVLEEQRTHVQISTVL
jgi:hypothetical protein